MTSSSSGTHDNDSVAEITAIAAQFYKDFGTYSVSATECVRNFSNSCSGKSEEFQDIQNNRNRTDFRIVGSTLLGSPAISIGSQRVTAEYRQRCQFEDVEPPEQGPPVIRTGRHYRVEGACFLTAVYKNWRWWLCESPFPGADRRERSVPLCGAAVRSQREPAPAHPADGAWKSPATLTVGHGRQMA